MKLGINVDHVATLRQARGGNEPNPVQAAVEAVRGGCDSIVAHLREDRRHINEQDIREIRSISGAVFNMEMSLADEIVKIAFSVLPDEVTLVPENRMELTTEGGLDAAKYSKILAETILQFHKRNIRVSIFLDPDQKQIKEAKKTGADCIEIHTGRYELAYKKGEFGNELGLIKESCSYGRSLGLTVNAGHGLNYENVSNIAAISGIESLNIGHSVISRAVFSGIENAVADIRKLIL